MDNRFDQVIAVKRLSHRSWNNLYNAACKKLGESYYFSTPNVENSSDSYLNTAIDNSKMTAAEIKQEIVNRNLIK